jgi:FtsP/CotA-like multicopper oxidase with cupredoxin domain
LRTSIHWHGIIQEHNAANDGVPGVTQCPIPPGGSFTYRFQATRYGSTWYHSHFTLQYSEGLLGPFIINGPTVDNWDIDLGTVLVQDFYRQSCFESWFVERSNPPLAADTGLINGKNKNGALGSFSEFNFTPGKKYRMRIINTSTDSHFQFSIDKHTMTVQAADFIPVKPYSQTILNIGIGIFPPPKAGLRL